MARAKKSPSDVTTAAEGVALILETPLQKTIEEASKLVGCAEIRLLEMFSERLESPEVMLWDSVPVEHEALLIEFKKQQEAFNSVRALEPEMSQEVRPVQAEAPVQEPPLLKEEPEAPKAKKGATPKQKSGALTKTRKAAIEQAAETVKQTGRTHEMATSTLAVQKGTRKGAKLAALELQAEDAAYEHIKRQGLQRKIAKLQDELLDEENFDPNELLTALGVPTTQETQAELDELVGNVLGKLQTATTEILDNSWANGYDLEAATLNLDRLMNSYE